jgi:hypothetical protein
MKMKNSLKLLFTGLLVCSLIVGCKKDEIEDTDTATTSDNALAEASFSDAENISDQAANGAVTTYRTVIPEAGLLSTCATVTIDTTVTPKVITINFGTANCLCLDGRYRRGQILVSFNGAYRDSASTHTITFSNYYVNDNKIDGTKTVTNRGHNSAGHLYYDIAVNGSIVLANGGGTITWSSARQREWIAGESTLIWSDDEYLITGSASGTTAKGVAYSAVIGQALRIKLNCKNIVSGTIAITPSGKLTRTINYGDGTCDDKATVTIGGNVFNISLR